MLGENEGRVACPLRGHADQHGQSVRAGVAELGLGRWRRQRTEQVLEEIDGGGGVGDGRTAGVVGDEPTAASRDEATGRRLGRHRLEHQVDDVFSEERGLEPSLLGEPEQTLETEGEVGASIRRRRRHEEIAQCDEHLDIGLPRAAHATRAPERDLAEGGDVVRELPPRAFRSCDRDGVDLEALRRHAPHELIAPDTHATVMERIGALGDQRDVHRAPPLHNSIDVTEHDASAVQRDGPGRGPRGPGRRQIRHRHGARRSSRGRRRAPSEARAS